MERKKVTGTVTVEGARIGFRNFSGNAGRFNAEGDRSFALFLDDHTAEIMEADGWNVRWLQPRDDTDTPTPYVNVSVKFGKFPPRVFVISGGVKTALTEDTINMLDYADVENVDLIIRPYNWEAKGSFGVKAYLKVMYVTLADSDLDRKYAEYETNDDLPF